jgi:hypothetical protein
MLTFLFSLFMSIIFSSQSTLFTNSITNDIPKFLNMTNTYRQLHNTPPVVWNNTIAQISQKWSDHLAQFETLQHNYQISDTYGENLAAIGTIAPELDYIQIAIDSWYKEGIYYNYDNPGFSASTGHFTALLWASTTSIGAGISQSTTQTYIVMNFYPMGNVQGGFGENVLPKAKLSPQPPLHIQIASPSPPLHIQIASPSPPLHIPSGTKSPQWTASPPPPPTTLAPDYNSTCKFIINNKTIPSTISDCYTCFIACNGNTYCTAFSWNYASFQNWGNDEYCSKTI